MKITKLNTIEEISKIIEKNGYGKGLVLQHVKYDEKINESYDYQIIRQSIHDGTMLFSEMVIQESLLPLMKKESCHIDYVNKDVKDISYLIGDITLETEFENNKQVDTVKIPVKCNYEF
ncbi:hypothetical protein [Lysinibacillus fusiformis]|uniref:hypothetical protein n=1 Tax=Lysinibacillus fusiformis TaxID=28031 RepID=UPI00263A4B15|nr:hypothetical protein [Lysinibacillus fusiformis]MDC6267281.1 hypothetical protein [Lysinibacillus sphaericus]MDN4968285.1 hypothetical protein [Lysinibacillus fusiformis]MDN4968459.1 hypothetical protein [Lysinibacillus fusiformis]